jgi:hypothetical protein
MKWTPQPSEEAQNGAREESPLTTQSGYRPLIQSRFRAFNKNVRTWYNSIVRNLLNEYLT